MALCSSFRDRLELLDRTRNHRLSLLHAEKEFQARKSEVLSAKLASMRSKEQRCILLESQIAAQRYKIATLGSEIESLDDKYQSIACELRVLKCEVKELEEAVKEKERFYEVKCEEMEVFRGERGKFVERRRREVNELRNQVNELKSTFIKLQGSDGFLSNSEIAAAEMTKSRLLAVKENLDKNLPCNYEIRSQLQKQIQNILATDKQERRNLFKFSKNYSTVK